MNSGSIKSEDIVRCEVRGGKFWAVVSAPMRDIKGLGKRITVESLTGKPIPAQWVTSRQVIGHWGKRSGSKL